MPCQGFEDLHRPSASFRQSDQLFVCYGGCARGRAVSKQRLSHWIVDAITAAYTSQGLECPLHIRGHSTRAIASSWAWSRGRVTFPRSCPRRSVLKWSLFTLSIPLPLLQVRMRDLHLLCPVRALKLYVDRSKVWRKSPQLLNLFWCWSPWACHVKAENSHWVRDAISLAYEVRNLPSPLSLRAHSTRGVASSQALFRGYPWRIFVLRQDGPLRTPLSGFTTLTLIRLRVLRSCLFELTVCCWFIIGPDRQRFSAWRVWYIVPEA